MFVVINCFCSIRKIVDKRESCLRMKLNKTKIGYIIRKMNQKISGHKIAEELNISLERVYQIYREYLKTRSIPILKQQGRPRKQLTESEINLIKISFSRYNVSVSLLSKIIFKIHNVKINHNKIHEILLKIWIGCMMNSEGKTS